MSSLEHSSLIVNELRFESAGLVVRIERVEPVLNSVLDQRSPHKKSQTRWLTEPGFQFQQLLSVDG